MKSLPAKKIAALKQAAEGTRFDEYGWSVYSVKWLIDAGVDFADAEFIVKASPEIILALIASEKAKSDIIKALKWHLSEALKENKLLWEAKRGNESKRASGAGVQTRSKRKRRAGKGFGD